ncbi:hypothetical protein NCS52_01453200 [Fusarium sp. LHS14.1]|nr:hypothetical protein NCS52_01453200 [Fusarium sp. LHS14.1]
MHNEDEQITQLTNLDQASNRIETYHDSLVVFINGARPQAKVPVSWNVTFAPTSRHNLSGALAPNTHRTVTRAKQEALLRFLKTVKSQSFDRRWQKVIVAVPNDATMKRIVEFLETDDSNYDSHPASHQDIRNMKNGLNVEFWLVPKNQIMGPSQPPPTS